MTQGERDETKGGGSTPEASAEELRITHDWARRRLELYDRMERAIRDEISYALRSAADIRSDVEKDADAYMRRLQADRLRLLEEISELRRTRHELEEEFNRRRTEQETELSVRLRIQEEELSRKASALDTEHTIRREQMDEELANRRAIEIADIDKFRSEAANAVELMISRAQTRKNELEEEARALEERVGHIQGMIDNFLNSQIQSLRGSLSGILPPKQSGGASTEATLSSLVSGIQGTRSAPARASTSISADVAAAERAVAEARAIAERAAADRAAADAQAQAERAAARAAAEEAARHAAEDAARRAAEEAARHEADAASRRTAEEAARHAAEEAARHAAEEGARRAAEDAARREAYAASRRTAEEAARHAAEEAARHAADEAARHAADEAARHAAEEAARHAAEEAARHAAEEAARHAAEEASRHAAEEASRHAAEEASRHAAEEASRHAAEEAARHAAEEAAQHAAEEAARHAAEEAAQSEAQKAPEEAAEHPSPDGDLGDSAMKDIMDEGGPEVPEPDADQADDDHHVEVPEGSDPDAIVRTTVVIAGVPGFSRALALQRTIAQVDGVSEAKANGYERGILTLEISHKVVVPLRGRLTKLDGVRLQFVSDTDGVLNLTAD